MTDLVGISADGVTEILVVDFSCLKFLMVAVHVSLKERCQVLLSLVVEYVRIVICVFGTRVSYQPSIIVNFSFTSLPRRFYMNFQRIKYAQQRLLIVNKVSRKNNPII